MDRNEILHDPRHLGVPSGASKMISELTVHLAQTVHLSWNKISTISKRTKTSFPFEPRHLGVPFDASKTISEAMVQLAQNMHLSCTESNTVSKRTETSFHLSLVTQEYHPVHPKQFLSLWYIWCKPCTYRAMKLTLSPKGSKRDSTWQTSPRISIRGVQNDFWGFGMFGTNCGSILHRNTILHDPHHLGVPSGASKMISKPTVHSASTVYLSWIKISTVSKRTKTSFYLSLVT
jgi:hypothetical protein